MIDGKAAGNALFLGILVSIINAIILFVLEPIGSIYSYNVFLLINSFWIISCLFYLRFYKYYEEMNKNKKDD